MEPELLSFRPRPPSFVERWFYGIAFASAAFSLAITLAVGYEVHSHRFPHAPWWTHFWW